MKTMATIMVSLILGLVIVYLSADKQLAQDSTGADIERPVQQTSIAKNTDTLAQFDRENNRLESELMAASNEISDLIELNRSLSQLVEQVNIPIPASTSYTGLLEGIDQLPVGFIKQQLSYLLNEEYISTIENPHQFSKSLVGVALSQEQSEDFSGAANIVFSYSPIKGWRELGAETTIDEFDTLYAHISPTQDIAKAIIKWQHADSGEILVFNPLTLDVQNQSQYVVIRPDNGWYKGHYQVTIHDMDNDRQLVGANSYHVSAIHSSDEIQDASGPDDDILQDLIMTGRAIPKINQ